MKFYLSKKFSKITGLAFMKHPNSIGVKKSQLYSYHGPSFEIVNLRLVSRVGPDGKQVNNVVFSIIQRCGVVLEKGEFVRHYIPGQGNKPKGGFTFTGGCTLIFDLDTLTLKYAISKPLLDQDQLENQQAVQEESQFKVNLNRVLRQYKYEKEDGLLYLSEFSQYFGDGTIHQFDEPFAFLHRR
jgi:hypothetical protein